MSLNAIVVDDFYDDPESVRQYAISQETYKPYELCSKPELVPDWAHDWHTTKYMKAKDCPFKSSESLIKQLEDIVGEKINRKFWDADFPVEGWDILPMYSMNADELTKYRDNLPAPTSAVWNCSIHSKYRKDIKGTFVHTHSIHSPNWTGSMGWAGVVYLTPNAPLDSGLNIWKSRDGRAVGADHNSPDPNRWELVDQYGNVFNRLVIHRGNVPHSGGSGWDATPDNVRLFQTFFFQTESRPRSKLNVKKILP